MAEDKDAPSGFKVVDRRGFSTDGVRREAAGVDQGKPEASPSRPAAPPARSPQSTPEPPDSFGDESVGFPTLISYLSTTAMFQLGALAGPGGERIPADLPNAQRTIALLEILQDKTQGNLTPEEAHFLEEALYELRLAYLEMEKRQTRRAK